MKLTFTKMHGLGNDFIIIDATQKPFDLSSEDIQKLGKRYTGVGFDQLLVVEPSPDLERYDFSYRIFNNNGSEVGNCGNGARCFAKYVFDHGLTDKKNLRVITQNTVMELVLLEGDYVQVNMGVPNFLPKAIPLLLKAQEEYVYEDIRFGAVSMGNPHAVLLVPDLNIDIEVIAQKLQQSPIFPEGVNVGFMQVVQPNLINLRVYERGVGETQACGTGACAAVAYGIKRKALEKEVTVNLKEGCLEIAWQDYSAPLYMKGPAITVFEGTIDYDE